MMWGQQKQPRQRSDDCKIKIKETSEGRTISFSGNCSKEQLALAKEMGSAKDVKFEQEDEH